MARIQLKIWMAPLTTLSQAAPTGLAEGEIAIASETNTLYKRPDGNPTGSLIPLGSASNQTRAKAATTANISLAGLQTIDSVPVANGDIVLVKNQTNAAQNGLYTVAPGTWTRTAGSDTWANIVSMMVIIERGAAGADTIWVCTSDSGGTLGSTAVSFLPVSNSTSAILGTLSPTADTLPYFTGSSTASTTVLTSFARDLLDDNDATTARGTLGAAPVVSPAFAGIPTAPTATAGTNTSQLATTAFVAAAVTEAKAGSVASADVLTTARTITASGDATSSAVTFDGSTNISIPLTLVNSGVTAGVYSKVTVDEKGRVTSGAALTANDIPALDWSKITTGKPTTLRDFGITDAASLASPVLTGIPTAPTAAAGTNNDQLATTAFVQNAVSSPITSFPSINTSGNAVIGGNLTLAGDLIVSGTTTTFNSTTMTVDDPIMTLGGDTSPTVDDGKDRGIEFRWHDGAAAKVGFFGFDDSRGKFTFIPDAVNTSEVFSGAVGTIVANLEGTVIGNASTAAALATARTITATGDATSSAVSFDGSANISIPLTLANSGVAAGTYPKVTVDAKGRVTAGTSLVAADIPALDWSKIVTGKPTTLSGYGITDASSTVSPALTGVPTAPTAAAGTNTTQLATTAFVTTAVSNLTSGASASMNTFAKVEAAFNADIDGGSF